MFRDWWLITTLLLTSFGCSSGLTPADEARLKEARQTFSDTFDIRPRRGVYIEARYLAGGCPEKSEALRLFTALLLQPDGSLREDTRFAYLNLSDKDGDFCHQLYLDPGTREVVQSDQAYY